MYIQNFTRFKRLFSEHQFIFVGDNGQGDIDLGKTLLQHPPLYAVVAVLIHDVIRNHRVAAPAALARGTSYRWRECDQHGITLFRTYIGASFRLYALGLLSLDAVVRVVEKTAAAFVAIAFDSPVQKRNLADEIMRDVAEVVAALPSNAAMALVATLHDDLVTSSRRSADDETERLECLV